MWLTSSASNGDDGRERAKAQLHGLVQQQSAAFLFQPHYNAAMLSMDVGDMQAAKKHVERALGIYGAHAGCRELLVRLDDVYARD